MVLENIKYKNIALSFCQFKAISVLVKPAGGFLQAGAPFAKARLFTGTERRGKSAFRCTSWRTGIFFFFFLINFLIYFWLCWVFVAARRLSLAAASGGYSSLRCAGFSLRWLLLSRSTALGARASVVVARGLSSCGSRALERRLSCCGARA